MTSHIHWWLVGLAFGLGLVLTFTLMVGPVKSQRPEDQSGSAQQRQAKKAATAEVPRKPTAARKGASKKQLPAGKKVPKPTAATTGAKTAAVQESPGAETAPPQHISDATESHTEQPAGTAATGGSAPQAPHRFAPYGPGSARADADGNGPEGWLVKGRTDTRLYYTPEDPAYDATTAQVWFQDEAAAARAFFSPWRKSARRE